jgi:hypothetical protein
MEDQKHAHHYPGRELPGKEDVKDAKHDAKALKAGKATNLGVSASGSHKGIYQTDKAAMPEDHSEKIMGVGQVD